MVHLCVLSCSISRNVASIGSIGSTQSAHLAGSMGFQASHLELFWRSREDVDGDQVREMGWSFDFHLFPILVYNLYNL